MAERIKKRDAMKPILLSRRSVLRPSARSWKNDFLKTVTTLGAGVFSGETYLPSFIEKRRYRKLVADKI